MADTGLGLSTEDKTFRELSRVIDRFYIISQKQYCLHFFGGHTMGSFRVYQDFAITNEGKTFQTGFTDLMFFFVLLGTFGTFHL